MEKQQNQSNTPQSPNKCSLCRGLGMVHQHNGQYIKCPACFTKSQSEKISDTVAKEIISEKREDMEKEIDETLELLKSSKDRKRKINFNKKK